MSDGFSLLWSSMLNSSIWVKESKETRLVWIAVLAMKNKDGVVRSSKVGLADRAKVTVVECEAALAVLMAPDVDDTSGVDEGRRLRELPGVGWLVVNHEKYRYSSEAKRAFWAQQQAERRARKGLRRQKGGGAREALVDRGVVPVVVRSEGEKAVDGYEQGGGVVEEKAV